MWPISIGTITMVQLVIAVVAKKPIFINEAKKQTVTVRENSAAVLPCSVLFLGEYKVTWIDNKGEKVQSNRSRYTIERGRVQKWDLHISRVRPSDEGRYRCQINTHPVQIKTVRLSVMESTKTVAPHGVMPIVVTFLEGYPDQLVCNVTGRPTTTIKWYRQGDEDKKSSRKPVASGQILRFDKVDRSNTGLYVCVALSGEGSEVNLTYEVQVSYPPEVRAPLRCAVRPEGSDVILKCHVTAFPPATTTWKRNNAVIRARPPRRIIEVEKKENGQEMVTLTIAKINARDFGLYTCTSINPFGRHQTTIFLHERLDSEDEAGDQAVNLANIVTPYGSAFTLVLATATSLLRHHLSDRLSFLPSTTSP